MKTFLRFFLVLKVCLYFFRLIYCQEDLVTINSRSEINFNLNIYAFDISHLFLECGSMYVMGEWQFQQLETCVTIEGSLTFSRFTYNYISFPNLLYIRDGLKISYIDNLTSVRQLLPNLVHIQGKTLETSLEIFQNKDLEELGFKKLMKIDFGYVTILSNPRLCLSDMISWSPFQDSDNYIEVCNPEDVI